MLVSVILPVHNRAGLIGRSIRSVLAQTEPGFELIVVDDASTDRTPEAIAAYRDARVRYLRLEQNRGAAGARNAGIGQAQGDCIAFQDSDDEWMPDKLEKQLRAMAEGGVGVVYSDMLRVLRDGTERYHASPDVRFGCWLDRRTGFYQTYCLGIQTTLVRRELFDQAGRLDEGMGFYDDLELFLRLAQVSRFVRIREPLVRYYDTGGLVGNWRQELRDRRRILRIHRAAIDREDGAFGRGEALYLAVRSMLGPLARSWTQRQDNLYSPDWRPEKEG